MDDADQEVTRRILGAWGLPPEMLGTHSNVADARFSQGGAWTAAPTATPLADLRAVQAGTGTGGLYDRVWLDPAVYQALRQIARRAWWRALPRRDKRALRRWGLTQPRAECYNES